MSLLVCDSNSARTSSSAGSPNIRESDDKVDIQEEREPVSSRDAVGLSDNLSVHSIESEPLCQADEMGKLNNMKSFKLQAYILVHNYQNRCLLL